MEGLELFPADASVAIGIHILEGRRAGGPSRPIKASGFRTARAMSLKIAFSCFAIPASLVLGRRAVSPFSAAGMLLWAAPFAAEFLAWRRAIGTLVFPGAEFTARRWAIGATVSTPPFGWPLVAAIAFVSATRPALAITVRWMLTLFLGLWVDRIWGACFLVFGPRRETEGQQADNQGACSQTRSGFCFDFSEDRRDFHGAILRQRLWPAKCLLCTARAVFHGLRIMEEYDKSYRPFMTKL
jgi:hypothetical protein